MKPLQSDRIPKPKGHYSVAIEHNGLLYTSGQLPRNPETGEIPEGIEAQTWQVFNNIEHILTEAGTYKTNILQVRIYIPNMNMWDAVNKIYADFMGNHKPVRTIVPTRELHFGALIEVEVVAAVNQ